MTATASEKSQTDALYGPNLILDVENFGPIAEAKNIEFKPMTVFVGPSNTGKTYLAMLLHSVLKARQGLFPGLKYVDFPKPGLAGPEIEPDFERFSHDIYSREVIYDIQESEHGIKSFEVLVADLEDSSQMLLENATRSFLHKFANSTNKSIIEYFGVNSIEDLSNRFHAHQNNIGIRFRDESLKNVFLVDRGIVEEYKLPERLVIHIMSIERIDAKSVVDSTFQQIIDLESAVSLFALSSLTHLPFSHYFSAGRTGIMDTHRELAASILGRYSLWSPNEHPTDRLSVGLTTNEFLQSLVRLRALARPAFGGTMMEKVAVALERGVLGGSINVVDTANITHFEYENSVSGVTIPLDQAASMVTEIAPIVMFLRQHIDEGDLLIIDEPEAHLHPAAQQQMAAALAFMVRSGLRVLITTHSHYMVEQFSAFVNASKLDEETRRRALALGGALGEEDIYLKEDETAVYSFLPSEEHGGSVVKEIFMGDEYEYGPVDHTDATTDQFNRLQSVLLAREEAESNGLG